MSKSLGNVISPHDLMKTARRRHPAAVDGAAPTTPRMCGSARRSSPARPTPTAGCATRCATCSAISPDFSAAERLPYEQMPELERWVLHRLAELDRLVREANRRLRFPPPVLGAAQLLRHRSVGVLLRRPQGRALLRSRRTALRRRAARTVLDQLFDCLTAWLAPVLVFTAEEAWLHAHPGATTAASTCGCSQSCRPAGTTRRSAPAGSGFAGCGASSPARSRSSAREAHRLEPARRRRRSSSAPDDARPAGTGSISPSLRSSAASRSASGAPPAAAFTLPDAPGIGVVPRAASGARCARCWQVLPEVGGIADAPDLLPALQRRGRRALSRPDARGADVLRLGLLRRAGRRGARPAHQMDRAGHLRSDRTAAVALTPFFNLVWSGIGG